MVAAWRILTNCQKPELSEDIIRDTCASGTTSIIHMEQ